MLKMVNVSLKNDADLKVVDLFFFFANEITDERCCDVTVVLIL